MQYIIGIDIAKEFNFATIIDFQFNQIIKPFKFNNDISGFEEFIYTINKSLSSDDYFLVAKTAIIVGATDTFINPTNIDDLKKLTRFRQSYVFKNSQLKVQLHSLLDLTFPEYSKIFTDTFSNTSLHLLKEFQTANDFATCDIRTLTRILKEHSKGRLSRDKAIQIKDTAKLTVASKSSPSYMYLIKLITTDLIEHLKTLKQIDQEIYLIMEKLDSPITTIPRIATTTGAVIISEIGDINKFDAPNKIVAYAGLDASVNESGNFIGTKNKISKRGSTELRSAFIMLLLLLHNMTLF